MLDNKELQQHVEKRLEEGVPSDVIISELREAGWKESAIQRAIYGLPDSASPAVLANLMLKKATADDNAVKDAVITVKKESSTFMSAIAKNIKYGFVVLGESVSFLFKMPIFLFPIFFAWIAIACVVLCVNYFYVDFEHFWAGLLFVYGIIFVIAFIISIANIIMLEIMQQIELGKQVSILKAVTEAFIFDFFKVIPIAMIWSIVWLFLAVARLFVSQGGRYARLHPGVAVSNWLFKFGISMFAKLVRMYIFLALPVIAWENKGPFKALSMSLVVIKKHTSVFIATYTATGVLAIFMAVPVTVVLLLSSTGVQFSGQFWMGVIFYESIVWTLGIYLEQMSVALIYRRHMLWKKRGEQGDISDVPKPKLMSV